VAVDVGTGDGSFVCHTARKRPDDLIIGVDAAVDNLRAASQRAAAKPSRGGLANALFGQLALEDAPGDLAGLADEVTVLLPWGSLLAAVARPDPDALGRLRALCKPGAALRVVFGYGLADAGALTPRALPPGDAPGFAREIARCYREMGFAITAAPITTPELRELPTTWAKKLAFSNRPRAFWQLRGQAT
jgi:16S rRNA (adenine(1408)-N(1))-methyltransferase